MRYQYAATSLRELVPCHWGDTATGSANGMIEAKDLLAYQSHILGFGVGAIEERAPNKKVAKFVKEHCRSAMRLRAMAICAYETVGNCMGRNSWASVGSPMFLCLTAASSTIDALACVLWAVLFNEVPSGRRIPDFCKLVEKMRRLQPPHPLSRKIVKLSKMRWLTQIREARNCVVHRGLWPMWNDCDGLGLVEDQGIFKRRHRPHSKYAIPAARIHRFNLPKLMVGFLVELERWEIEAARLLNKNACYKSTVPNGIIITVNVRQWTNFNDPFMLFEAYRSDFASTKEFLAFRTRVWRQNPPKDLSPGAFDAGPI